MFKKIIKEWIRLDKICMQWVTINGWEKWKKYFVEDEIEKKKKVSTHRWKIGNVER